MHGPTPFRLCTILHATPSFLNFFQYIGSLTYLLLRFDILIGYPIDIPTYRIGPDNSEYDVSTLFFNVSTLL